MRAWFAQKSEREGISFSYARVGHTFSREKFYVAKEDQAEQTQWSLLTLLSKQRLNQVTFQLRQVEQVIEETCLPVSYAVGDRVLHRGAWYGGNVSALYGKQRQIRVREAKEGDCLEHGNVYFAPADHHLLFGAARLRLSRGPNVHFARPAIDPTGFTHNGLAPSMRSCTQVSHRMKHGG